MRGVLAVILLILLCKLPAYAENECTIANAALRTAAEIRKLAIKQEVPCVLQSKDQVKAYLLSLIEEQLPQDKLVSEEFVYKKLGFFPEDFKYKQGIIDLYLSQIGGYYDPKKDRFIMAGWLPSGMQTAIAVHELTHALQDQYYNLEILIDPKFENGDKVLARSALAEGDATAVMYDYSRKLNDEKPLADEPDVNSLIFSNVAASQMAGNAVPKSLQMLLIFPYTSGFRFAHEIIKREGYEGLKKAFENPPATTEEILYPEKYFSGKKDYVEFHEADLRQELGSEFKVAYKDSVGQFAMMALLSMSSAQQADIQKAADGWGGDKLILFESENKKVIVWKTAWDQENDLEEFKKLFHGYLKERFKNFHENKFNDDKSAEWKISQVGKELTYRISVN